MKNYSEMSDFEINREVAVKLGIQFPSKPKEPYCSIRGNVIVNNGCDGRVSTPYFGDYCNNFDYWYVLAEKYGMAIDVNGKASVFKSATGSDEIISHKCEGKLGRAVAICFLKMKDAQNDN